jgi:hypothetical protein
MLPSIVFHPARVPRAGPRHGILAWYGRRSMPRPTPRHVGWHGTSRLAVSSMTARNTNPPHKFLHSAHIYILNFSPTPNSYPSNPPPGRLPPLLPSLAMTRPAPALLPSPAAARPALAFLPSTRGGEAGGRPSPLPLAAVRLAAGPPPFPARW